MEHADTAQLAAVGGALGSVLVLLARGRLTLLAGLVVLAVAEAGLALSLGDASLDKLTSAAGAAAAVAGLLLLGGAAALLAWRPAWCRWRSCWRRRSGRRSTSPARTASWSRSPRTAASAGCCRSTSCSPPPRLRARLARAARATGARAAARDRAAGRGVLRAGVPVAAVGGRRGGRHQPARVLHAAVRGAARHRRPRRLPGLRAARAGGAWRWGWPRCSRWSGL